METHIWLVTEPGSAFGESVPVSAFTRADHETDSETLARAMAFAHSINGGDVIAVPVAIRQTASST